MDTLGDVLDRQSWLKPVEGALTAVAKVTLEGKSSFAQKVRNFLHGTWFGHPLHPAITDIPLGAWTVATAMDLYEMSSGDERFSVAADMAVKVGLFGAAGAAVTGFTDWHYTYEKPRRVGSAHALVNVAATLCYLGSWWQRRQGDRRGGVIAGLSGYALAMTGAYLGGHLVFNERIGVNHAPEELPSNFVGVGELKDLKEGRMHKVEKEGVPPLFLVRRGDQVFAMAEKCSHLGGPLSEGKFDGITVECPWHQSRFDIETGEVVAGPATFRQPCFQVRVREGKIEVKAPRGMRANPY